VSPVGYVTELVYDPEYVQADDIVEELNPLNTISPFQVPLKLTSALRVEPLVFTDVGLEGQYTQQLLQEAVLAPE